MIRFPKRTRIFYIAALVIQLNAFLFGQSLSFKNYTDEDGLPQNTVFSVFQCSKGFIWLGTEAGLVRFDGINFLPFTTKDGLINSTVRAIAEDSAGNLWIGTINGISVFDGENFTNYNSEEINGDNYIYSITVDKNNRVWFGTKIGGIYFFSDGKFHTPDSEIQDNQFGVYDLLTAPNGDIIAATDKEGVLLFDGTKLTHHQVNQLLPNKDIRSLFIDSSQKMWIGTENGLQVYHSGKLLNIANQKDLPAVQVRAFTEDLEGNVWIAFYGEGLVKFDGKNFISYQNSGMVSGNIQCALKDFRGDLWFGTYLGGISRLPADHFKIYNSEGGLADDVVYTISEDQNGSIYFGHYGYGITVLSNGKFSYLRRANGLIDDRVSSFTFDKNNNLWVATSAGISKFENGRFINYDLKNFTEENLIVSIFSTKEGDILAGGNSFVCRFNNYSNEFEKFIGKEDGLERGLVWDIFEDSDQSLWFATELFGVLKYQNGTISNVGGKDFDVNSILKDKRGNYWFALNGSGLLFYDGKEFRTIVRENGLSDDITYGILESNDKLFVSTLDGISILDLKRFYSKNEINFQKISKSDGLPSNEFNGGAHWKDAKGNLWFGTQKGVIEYTPGKKVANYEPRIFFDKIIISDGRQDSLIELNKIHQFGNEFNSITFEYISPNFFGTKNIKYNFRLKNVETHWITSKERRVSYRGLQPGNYQFEILAGNSTDNWTKNPLIFQFEILPPIYSTWWFRTGILLFIIAAIYFLSIQNSKRITKRNLELKRLVEEKTKELQSEKDKSDSLLHNILPSILVKELKTTGKVKPRYYENVTILFTDFEGFTDTASKMPADSLLKELNDIFKKFDEITDNNGLEKLKTSGDSYMAAAGLPQPVEDHAIKCLNAAFEMHNFISERNKELGIEWKMRIGINSGPVIAGVVGSKKFNYDIWGDTVNIASRMESTSEPGQINISENTFQLISNKYKCIHRGKIFVKGKGKLDMYFVEKPDE